MQKRHLTKFQHLFIIKTRRKKRYIGRLPPLDKEHLKYLQPIMILCETECFSSKIRNRQRSCSHPCVSAGKEKQNLSPFANDTIIYIENPRKSARKIQRPNKWILKVFRVKNKHSKINCISTN